MDLKSYGGWLLSSGLGLFGYDRCAKYENRLHNHLHELNQSVCSRRAAPDGHEILFPIRDKILQLRTRTTKIWTAVAERSGDTAFRSAGCVQKRRGALLPAAVQNLWLRRKPRWVHLCPSVVKDFPTAWIRFGRSQSKRVIGWHDGQWSGNEAKRCEHG